MPRARTGARRPFTGHARPVAPSHPAWTCCALVRRRTRACPRRAHRVLAGPAPGHVGQAGGGRRGSEGALARLGARPEEAGHHSRGLPARLAQAGPSGDRPGAPSRDRAPAHAGREAVEKVGARTPSHQREAVRAVPLPLDPAGRERLAQQRPRGDHAWRLYRAGLARGPGIPRRSATSTARRPTTARVPSRTNTSPTARTPRRSSRSSDVRSGRAPTPAPLPSAARTRTGSRTSAPASAATCRSKARGHRPTMW